MIRPPHSLAVILLAATLAACGGKPQAPTAPRTAPRLETLAVHADGAGGQQRWDGTVEAVDAAVLTAQTNARVLALPHDVGDSVAAGAVLVRLTDVEQQSAQHSAMAQAAAVKATYVEAEADYQRYAAIYPKGYVSKAAYGQVLARRNAARAQLDAAEAQAREAGAQQDYTTVRAPFAGVITRRYVQVGEAVAGPPFPQQLIALASLKQLRVEAKLPQAVAEALRVQGRAEVFLDGRRIASGTPEVFPIADPATHTVTVRAALPEGTPGLYPGMTVKLAFAAPDTGALAIPASALVTRGELQGVYVVDGDAVSLRQLRVGEVVDGRVEVLAGLDAGERIAVDPAAAARTLVAQHHEAAR